MRKLLLTTLLLSIGLPSLKAAKISQGDAIGIAETFLTSHSATRAGIDLSLATIDCHNDAVYIINNPSGGWVLVAADDAIDRKVLGYSTIGRFNDQNLPEGVQWLLDEYSKGIASYKKAAVATTNNTRTDGSVSPLLGDIAWDQFSPYNELCPEVNGEKSAAGCVNIAVAQIMRYYNYPEKGIGSHYYEWNDTRLSVDFSKSEYRWDLIKPTYSGNESTQEKEAVAKLIYDVAVANESMFAPGATGSSFNLYNFLTHFNYDPGLTPVIRDQCKAKDYEEILRAELNEGRPVYVEGGSGTAGGHSFVCDGYDQDGYFHYNFGWGAEWNGYFLCSATGFDSYPTLTIGIKPNEGNLPGLWAGTSDDVYWTENDYISCYFNAVIYSGLTAEIEAGLAVEEKLTGRIIYCPKTKSDPMTNIQVFGFTLDDELSDGEYIVYPISRVAGGEWKRVYVGENAADHVELKIADGVRTYTNMGVGGEMEEGVVLIDGMYYRFNDDEATVTNRNSRGNSYSGNVVIPSSVTYEGKEYQVTIIGEEAFKLSQLNTLIVGKNIRLIDVGAFMQCHVDNLVFEEGSNLKELASWAFNLADIPVLKLPEGLEILGACAFRGEIKSLDLPSTVRDLPSETISCIGLKDLYLHWINNEELPPYDINAITTDVSHSTLHVPNNCIELYRSHELWSKFGKISDSDTPVEVVKINGLYYTFDGEGATVTSPKTGDDDYSGDIIIPDYVTYNDKDYPVCVIGEAAFKATILNTLKIGENVRAIESEAFTQCHVDNFEFADNSHLKEIASMGFYLCSIEKLNLPEGLETIGENGLNGEIRKLTLPKSVNNLPSGSISVIGLTDLYVKWEKEDELPFYDISAIQTYVGNATLHVPEGCADIYRNHRLWSLFGSISEIKAIEDGINEIFADNSTLDVYNMQGMLVRQGCTLSELKQLPSATYILRKPNGRSIVFILHNK